MCGSRKYPYPSPSEFPMIFRGGGGGMDIFWNDTMLIWAFLFFYVACVFPTKKTATEGG